ncbi:MAG: FecR domain-containing protein [Leptolyngbyaceae cyanobacterium RU_5_1]|nr:FecR domain-containing protein [Leptolyngbyaceae cyanobacterium RU_5_1]
MDSRSFFAFTLILCSAGTLLLSPIAYAETLLSRATVQNLRNQVDLLLKQRSARPARKADIMTSGDALQTYRKAMAELRFNDRSLVRIGEQAVFQFRPNTRTLDLKKGTVLLLIPPGKGRTRVHTPNAAAGIRGSALFVRYIPDSGVSIVGALTNSDIEISNSDGSQTYILKSWATGICLPESNWYLQF